MIRFASAAAFFAQRSPCASSSHAQYVRSISRGVRTVGRIAFAINRLRALAEWQRFGSTASHSARSPIRRLFGHTVLYARHTTCSTRSATNAWSATPNTRTPAGSESSARPHARRGRARDHVQPPSARDHGVRELLPPARADGRVGRKVIADDEQPVRVLLGRSLLLPKGLRHEALAHSACSRMIDTNASARARCLHAIIPAYTPIPTITSITSRTTGAIVCGSVNSTIAHR